MRKLNGAASLLFAIALSACGGSETLGGSTGGDGSTDSPYRAGSLSSGSFNEGSLVIGQGDLAAGGSTSVSVDIVDASGQLAFGAEATVGFNSDCIARGLATVASDTTTTSTGSFTATYTAKGCSGADKLTGYVKIGELTLTATGTITVQSAQLGGIEFVSAEPAVIGMSGSPLQSQSTVTFRLRDNTGAVLANRAVDFALTTTVGGTALSPATANSDGAGLVRTTVQAGSVHTSVRVRASTTSPTTGQTITSQSDQLVITTGLPDQNSFSLSATQHAVDGDCDGASTTLTIRAADRYNNPVPKGTAVSFTTEGGKINGQCVTGDPFADTTEEAGACSVLMTVQNPRPADGRVTVLATAQGEESFIDGNGNGFHDSGEVFTDLPEAFVDADEDGIRDASEPILDFNSNGAYDVANGAFDGYVCDQPGLNCRSNLLDVRESGVIVFSRLSAGPVIAGAPTSISLAAGQSASFSFTIQDVNGNSLPSGTEYTLESTKGPIAPSAFGPFQTIDGDTISFIFGPVSTAGSGTLTLKVAVPDAGCGSKSFTIVIPVTVS